MIYWRWGKRWFDLVLALSDSGYSVAGVGDGSSISAD